MNFEGILGKQEFREKKGENHDGAGIARDRLQSWLRRPPGLGWEILSQGTAGMGSQDLVGIDSILLSEVNKIDRII